MTQVIKITKAGFNVLTENDPRNFIFDSTLNHLKTAGSGTIVKTIAANSIGSETVAHGLGILPLVTGYFRDTVTNNGRWYITMSQPVDVVLSRPLAEINVSHSIDTTNIYFYFINDYAVSHEIELKYEFFYEGN